MILLNKPLLIGKKENNDYLSKITTHFVESFSKVSQFTALRRTVFKRKHK